MAAAVPFMIAGATLVSAMGQVAAGNAQAAAYNANAKQQVLQGQQERNIAIEKSQEQGVDNERRAGAIAAAYGASGVDGNSGSPLEVMSDQATHGELNRQLMLWQGVAQQQSADTQGSFYNAEAKAAKNAGYNSALSTLFQGAAQYGLTQYKPGSSTPPKAPGFG